MFSRYQINRYNLRVYLKIIYQTPQILESNCRRVVDAIPPDVNGVISFHQKIINLLKADIHHIHVATVLIEHMYFKYTNLSVPI